MTEGICPSGWHIPSDEEWIELEMFLGMSESEASGSGMRGTDQGSLMKSTTGWNDYNGSSGNGTNSSGFNGLPGGDVECGFNGSFEDVGEYGYWWSASESKSSSWLRGLKYQNGSVDRWLYNELYDAFSARCISDSSTTSSVPTEPSSNRKLEKVIDALGREVNLTPNQILFYLYDDGSVEKKFVVE
jgi:uncharacterized protein (TIGR02145 family)